MATDFDVIVVGNYTIDLIFAGMDEFPQMGKDLICKDFLMSPGASYIQAVTMHRLGIKVGWAGDFGNDYFSQQALKCARDEGLDDSLFVIHDRSYRRVTAAASYPNDRAFITYYDPEVQIPAAFPALVKSQAKILYIPGLYYGDLFNIGIKLIRAKKMKLFMDSNLAEGNTLGKDKESKSIIKAIRNTDVFLPNAQEARNLTGESELELAMRKLGELCPVVVIKDGANGAYGFDGKEITHVKAISVEPTDTTGAGDNFSAGFVCAWLEGLPIKTCLKWGNIMGGLSATVLGGTTRKITRDEVKKYAASWNTE